MINFYQYSLLTMHDICSRALSNEYDFTVTSILKYGDNVIYFIISCDYDRLGNNNKSYIIYLIDDKIYYRDATEFLNILKDSNINGLDALTYEYLNSENLLDYIDAADEYSCKDLMYTILDTLGIHSLPTEIDESIKVKRPKLGSDGDIDKSKLVDDILHGDKELKDFEKNVERETTKAGVDNPLVVQPNLDNAMESTHMVLPNVHSITESQLNEKLEDMEIIYEPKDWVIIKENGMRAQVNDVVTNGDGKITMLTILASNGVLYDAEPNEIKPDPAYLENIAGREINGGSLNVPSYANFDIDPKTRLPYPVKNDTPATLADLNGKTVLVYITNEGYRMSSTPYIASLEDVVNSKDTIRVINESNQLETYSLNNIEFAEMPYAQIKNSNGETVKHVLVDAMNYIKSTDDDLVLCLSEGAITKLPKKNIFLI